jgi:hypothetical protein
MQTGMKLLALIFAAVVGLAMTMFSSEGATLLPDVACCNLSDRSYFTTRVPLEIEIISVFEVLEGELKGNHYAKFKIHCESSPIYRTNVSGIVQ